MLFCYKKQTLIIYLFTTLMSCYKKKHILFIYKINVLTYKKQLALRENDLISF